jgi:hypothetical protein
MNVQQLMQLNGMKNKFTKNHPMVPKFLKKIRKDGLEVNDVIEITVKKENGEDCTANIKIQESDLELLNQLMTLGSVN